ncbi:MAG: terminase small subunit [Peptococcaceae bacterium]|nr:terminase small subunit [Peptococcaceae bacterium]
MELTVRQLAFVDEYLIDLNGTQAAIRAGYSPRSASSIANDLMDKPHVADEIARRMAERSKRTGVNADRVIRELAKVAFADITDIVGMDGQLRPEVYTRDDTAAIASIKIRGNQFMEEREVTLFPKTQALKLLGEHCGLWNDKLNVEGDLSLTVKVDYGDGDNSSE